MQKKKVSLKAAIIGISAALGVALICSILYFSIQINSTYSKSKQMYFDKLYSISEKLINGDRDLYQAMVAAFQYYSVAGGGPEATGIPADIFDDYVKQLYGDYTENLQQTLDRAKQAYDIGRSDDTLFNHVDEEGVTFAQNYDGFLAQYNTWQGEYTLSALSGDWGTFVNDFASVRGYLSNMTDITEQWALEEETILTKEFQHKIINSIVLFGIILIILIVIAVLLIRNMRRSLNEFADITKRLADGNFADPVKVKSIYSEFGQLATENEGMRKKLHDAVEDIISYADNVSSQATETKNSISESQGVMKDISVAVDNLALGASSMAEDVQNTSAITIEIGSAIDTVSNSVNDTIAKVKQLSDNSTEIKNGLYELRKSDEATDSMAGEVAASVNETAELVGKISSAADGIINIFEMKYSDADYSLDKEEKEKLNNRIAKFRKETGVKEALWPTLVTTYGLKDGIHSATFVATLTMDDLFM